MEKYLISVIVPVYNCTKYLGRCVESIRRQTYKNLEIILVDDGSTDESGKLCDLYAHNDERIRVIHKQNSGLPGTRNLAIANARGKYLSFVDQDDFVKDTFIQRLYEVAEQYQADVVICNYEKGEQSEFKTEKGKTIIELFSPDEMLTNWHGKYKHLETVAWNKLYLKDIYEKNNIWYPEGWNCGEDVDTTHRVIACASKIAVTNEVLYYYFDNVNGMMGTVSKEKVHVNIMAQKKRIEFFKEHGYEKACERMLIKLQKYYMLMFSKFTKDSELETELKQSFDAQYKIINRLESTSFMERVLFWSFFRFSTLYKMVFGVLKR